MNRTKQQSSRVAAFALTLLLASASTAWADVKIVAQQTIKGLPASALKAMKDTKATPGAKPAASEEITGTSTTYYKGDKQRVENSGSVVITDFAAGTVWTLNPAAKTYSETNLKDVGTGLADNPMLNMFKVTGTADVKSSGETKTIAGKLAKNYKYTIKINMSAADGADPSIAAVMPNIGTIITGEQWTTDALTIPVNAVAASRTAMIKNLPPTMMKGMKLVGDKMGTITGVPLSSVTSVKVEMPKEFLAMMQGQGAGAGIPLQPIVTTTEVTSISEDPLDDALFTVPADYKKVVAPKPSIPGLPGGA